MKESYLLFQFNEVCWYSHYKRNALTDTLTLDLQCTNVQYLPVTFQLYGLCVYIYIYLFSIFYET